MGNKSSRQTRVIRYEFAAHPAPTRLDVAKEAIYNFFFHTFTNQDGYALATFSNEYTLLDVGNGLVEAAGAVSVLQDLKPTGGTRLFDSVVRAIQDFQGVYGKPGFGELSRPWVLVILTDGEDNLSKTTAQAAGAFIRAEFLNQLPAEAGNYVYVVGMGPDVRMMAALRAMMPSGNFKIMHVRNFSDLQAELAFIALQLVIGEEYAIQYAQAHGVAAIWAEVQSVARVRQQAIDFMFLLDISYSMKDPA